MAERMTEGRLNQLDKLGVSVTYGDLHELVNEIRECWKERQETMAAIQRHQPGGSPPLGGMGLMVNWILSDLANQRNVAQKNADYWFKINRVLCEECSKQVHPVTDAYRCFDCAKFYCPEHALAHFGQTGPLVDRLKDEKERLQAYINNPVTLDFIEAMKVEIPHQKERWRESDPLKDDPDWYWLIGWLGGKAIMDPVKDRDARTPKERKLHRIVAVAAAAANWFQMVKEAS